MLLFILALVGGAVVPFLDQPVAQPLARLARDHVEIEQGELRAVGLLLVLIVLGVVGWLLSSGSLIWVAVGVTLGYFGVRIVSAVRAVIENRNAG